MPPTRSLSPSAEKVLTSLLDQAASKAEYQRVLCVWLRTALAMPAAEIATALGWHTGSVHNLPLALSTRRGLSPPGRRPWWATAGVVEPGRGAGATTNFHRT